VGLLSKTTKALIYNNIGAFYLSVTVTLLKQNNISYHFTLFHHIADLQLVATG